MKKISIFTGALIAVALVMSACGQVATPAPPAAPEAAATAPPTTEPDPPAASEPVTITFWYALGGSRGEFLQAMIDEFNATNPHGTTVEATFSGDYGETAQKVIGSLEAGGLPHGGLIPAGPLWTCREGNYLIEDYINGPEGLDVDDFWPVLWDYNSYEGHICSLPFNNSTPVLFYNQDLMAAAGLDPESPPRTWDELRAMAGQIVAGGEGVWGVDTNSPDWWLKALVLQNGGQIMNGDATAPAFNSAAGYGAMQFWQGLVEAGLMPPAQHREARDLFIAGRLGFLISSTGSVGIVRDGARFEWGTAFLPQQELPGATVGGAALVMFPSDPAHEQATWRLLKWLVSPENAVSWTVATGYVPIRKSALEAPEMQQLYNDEPAFRAGFEQLEVASTYPHFWEMGRLDNVLGDAIEKVELGAASPKAALDEAAALLLEEMAQ